MITLLEAYFQENDSSNEDPLEIVIKDNPRFKVGLVPDPQNISDRVYYIGTGIKGANYTLRVKFLDYSGHGSLVDRDYYVANLSPNPESAARMADKNAPDEQIIYYTPFKLEKRSEARESNIIKFGKKHQGESIYDVAENDPEYVAWIAFDLDKPSSWINKPKHSAFRRELLKAIEALRVKEILDQMREQQKRQEEESAKRKIRREENKEKFEQIARVLDMAYGDFASDMAEKIRAGDDPAESWSDRMIDITADIYAKQTSGGKRRNTKAFKEKRKEFFDILGMDNWK